MSPSTTPLSPVDRREASQEPAPYLEPEKDKQNIEFNEQSTRTSSTVDAETEVKKLRAEDVGTTTDEEAVVAASVPQNSGNYPSGVKLAFIVVALVLSVFLFSLDQVGLPVEYLPIDTTARLTLDSDHRCNRHSQDY